MFAIVVKDSMTLGEAFVGFGTLMLAAFTAWLGFSTRTSAKAAREAVEAAEEPFVIATPTPLDGTVMRLREHEVPQVGTLPPDGIHRALDGAGGSFVRLRLWNVGQGPAIVTGVQLRPGDGNDALGGFDRHYPIAAGAVADIEIPSPAWPATACEGVLSIDYVRATGRRYRTASVASIGDPIVTCRTYNRTRLDLPDRTAPRRPARG